LVARQSRKVSADYGLWFAGFVDHKCRERP
jgi:hypothetical protein